ncbi:putrescine transport system substrate-binding protein [Colwellia chukchiensis]|uniref:Putrescine-binding periplasmic protein n=1 Tax=Colwellia chukchiensis TaxID=641665 RepID=A0A1H7G6G5_9GAMM|nr:polyamine ABC transporter substrate-binding protein [Colwellia chukchiensis]SEK33936.1 putrescine transport system substrate-binding protein [Colwellia chukchiensis]
MKVKSITLATALMTTMTAFAAEKVVNVYNWSDYIDPKAIEIFEQQTGIKVNYDVYDSNEILEAKLMSGGSGYDVVVPTGSFLERQAKAGIYSAIDKSQLPNYANIDSELAAKMALHDPDNKYGVPYTWGTIGLGINQDMVKQRLGDVELNSLDLVFKPEVAAKLADCGIGMLDSPAEVMSIALNYIGLDPNSENGKDLKNAQKMMQEVRPHYKYFNSGRLIADLANGDICVAIGYNGDMLQAQSRANEAGQGVKVAYHIPKEGTIAWFDMMAIPGDAPHKQEAYQFINYILSAKTGASIANYVYYAVANTAADEFILDEIKSNSGIYPNAATKAKLFTQQAHTPRFDRKLTRAWTTIKTGR